MRLGYKFFLGVGWYFKEGNYGILYFVQKIRVIDFMSWKGLLV